MGFLDRAKEAAQRAKSGARVAREQGQHRLGELQARRQAEVLLREVGLASYEEHSGDGGHEAVVRAVAKLDEHVRVHNIDLSTSGLRGYLRTATGGGDDTARGTRRRADSGDQPSGETGAAEPEAGDTDRADQPGDESGTKGTSGEASRSETSAGAGSKKKTSGAKSSGGGSGSSTSSSAKKTTAKKTTTSSSSANKNTSTKKSTSNKKPSSASKSAEEPATEKPDRSGDEQADS